MSAFSEDTVLRAQIVNYLNTLGLDGGEARPTTPTDSSGRRTRGADEFIIPSDPLDGRIREVRAFLDLFDQSADLRHLVHDLVETSVQATEQRMVNKFSDLAAEAEMRQQWSDRRQRRDNLFLTTGSLLIGWFVSVIGTPLTLLSHVWPK